MLAIGTRAGMFFKKSKGDLRNAPIVGIPLPKQGGSAVDPPVGSGFFLATGGVEWSLGSFEFTNSALALRGELRSDPFMLGKAYR